MRKTALIICALMLLNLFAACGMAAATNDETKITSQTTETLQPPAQISAPSPTSASSPTLTPSPVPTQTPTAPQTQTPTQTQTPDPTPTPAPTTSPMPSTSPAPTLTPLPTMPPEEGVLYDYFKSADLPRIDISTDGGISPDAESLVRTTAPVGNFKIYDYVGASISVSNCPDGEFENVRAQVRVRGNATSMLDKKPLRIKFDEKRAMCALNGGAEMRNWVLLAEYGDRSLLRNAAAFFVGRSLLTPDGFYCADFRLAEVYINGSYNGVYLLTEQQQVNAHRVNVPEPKDAQTTHAGYFFEYDMYAGNEDPLKQIDVSYEPYSSGLPISMFVNKMTIKSDIYSEEQRDFLQKCVQTIWDVIYNAVKEDHSDLSASPYYTMDADGNRIAAPHFTTAREAVGSVVNLRSLTDMYLLCELAADPDTGASSFFFSLDMSPEGDRLLTFTAPWDFDRAFGKAIGIFDDPGKSYIMEEMMTSGNPWFLIFKNESWFWEDARSRFKKAWDDGVFKGVADMVVDLSKRYKTYFDENSALWGMGAGLGAFNNQKEAAEALANWLRERAGCMREIIDEQVLRTQ